MRLITLSIILFAFLFSGCSDQNLTNNNRSKPSKKQTVDENGICWQDCLMPSIYEEEVLQYNVFTGDAASENVEIELVEIELGPATTKWVKKKTDRNCLSADPNDCLVWCLVEVPAEVESFQVLTDVSQSENYKVKEIKRKKLIKKGGYVEKQKVICKDKITSNLVETIQDRLNEKNYHTGSPTQKINSSLRAGLSKYQRENGLPVGLLNFQTLDMLGVVY